MLRNHPYCTSAYAGLTALGAVRALSVLLPVCLTCAPSHTATLDGSTVPSDGAAGTGGAGPRNDAQVGGLPTRDGPSGAGAGGTAGGGGAADAGPGAAAAVFPRTSPWYADVSSAPLDAQSGPVMAGLAAHGGWGTGTIKIDFSIEVLRADPGLAPRPFTRSVDFYDPDCDFVPVPVPPGGRLEGENNYTCAGDGDCHLLVLQGTRLFEMWRANIGGTGGAADNPFGGGCLAVWDTTRDYWSPAASGFARGDQCTSADAAGYPIAALLFNAD